MGTAFRGAFVILWSQTETDGVRAGPRDLIATGATWRWTGSTLRVDAPHDPLVLSGAEGAAELRQRAGRMVARLMGFAPLPARSPAAGETVPDHSFAVTDGRQRFLITLLDPPGGGAPLLLFAGDVPPADTDLWVMETSLSAAPADPAPGGVICFAPGTRILTPNGARPVENLRPGDWVETRDNGPHQVIWRGHRHLTGARLHAMPHLRPVRLRSDALGPARPDADLIVSPQHRLLVRGAAARALFNTPEVLVAAADLVNGGSIATDHALREVTYIHLLLEDHQIIWANGLETESFHPDSAGLAMIDAAQRAALLAVLPGVYGAPARRSLSAPEAAILRHDLAA